MAVALLGVGLLGQAIIATWCALSAQNDIMTWSSNPLNNTLALRQLGLPHVPGRCMMEASQIRDPDQAQSPRTSQGNLFSLLRTVRIIIGLIWMFVVLSIGWFIAMIVLTRVNTLGNSQIWTFQAKWSPEFGGDANVNAVELYMAPDGNNMESTISFPLAVQAFFGILFVCAIQGSQTMGLHSVELLVNMARDEDAWRESYTALSPKRKGASWKSNPFFSAAKSWQNVILFLAKAALHWIVGQSISPTFYDYREGAAFRFDMVYMRVLVLAIIAILIAVFATYVARRRPHGCQPAAWGHLQTLANLIDCWNCDGDGKFHWGDKGYAVSGVRHAGTSGSAGDVGMIQMGQLYAGISKCK